MIIGSGIGGISTIEGASQTIESRGPSRISPYFIPMSLINLAAGSAAIDMDAHGNVSSVVTACAAATNAIGEAFHRIRDGYEDVMAAGGSEAAVTPVAMAGFASMRALHEGEDPNRASIPFDAERKGFVMGEGAGVLILEELKHALARNAEIYREVIGYGSTCDANHITAPLADGAQAARAMTMAIEDGAITAADVDYINAHGTSTPLNDASETLAVKKAFGAAAMKPYVSSTKSMSGHLLGASGAPVSYTHLDVYKRQKESCMLINELLGIKYPIFQGAMANIATPEFAAAVSNCGALGIIATGAMDAVSYTHLMNEIPSPMDGIVQEILITNEAMVEFDQELIRIGEAA